MSENNGLMKDFNLSQRRHLAVNFKDCLVNMEANGQPYFKRLGPGVQAVMREAVDFICLYKSVEGKISKETQGEGDEKKEVEFVNIAINVYQPGTNDKITLERRFTKALLETR